MKEEILQKYENEILEWLKQGKNLIEGQAPLICEEIINYGYYYSLITMILCAIATIVIVIFNYYMIKEVDPKPEDEWFFWTIVVSTVLSALSVIGFVNNLINLFYITFAPRLYIIDQIKELIK